MSTYKAWQVTGEHQFAWVQRDLVDPQPGHVRIRVRACGVCHSDMVAAEALLRDPSVPVVPGHEIVGVIDAVGDGVRRHTVGDRVGVGYLGGQCHECEFCRRGDFVNCQDQPGTGTTTDGGYAEYVDVRASGVVAIPDGLGVLDTAPLLCGGITVYNALLAADAPPRSLIGVQGLGGLGHLAVQYAKSLGYRIVVIARGTEKAALAAKLGADDYIDSETDDPGAALTARGGAAAIVATAARGASMSALNPGAGAARASAGGRRRAGPHHRLDAGFDLRHPHDHRNPDRIIHRERRQPGLQCRRGRQTDDRGDAAGPGPGSLRADDVRCRAPAHRARSQLNGCRLSHRALIVSADGN
jgi:alcohol dehydrogenase, propanol-preferring